MSSEFVFLKCLISGKENVKLRKIFGSSKGIKINQFYYQANPKGFVYVCASSRDVDYPLKTFIDIKLKNKMEKCLKTFTILEKRSRLHLTIIKLNDITLF